MKLNLIILFAIIIQQTTFSQEFKFEIQNNVLSDMIEFEENLGSERIPNNSNHISRNGIAQPIKFKRKQNIIPDLISQYFYYEKDSTISYILHEWDVSNFEKKDNNKQTEEFQNALIDKYKDIERQITEQYGESEIRGNLSEFSKISDGTGLKKKNIWKLNDSLEIEMYTTISNFYEKKGMMTKNPTHRIRLYVRNKSKNKKIVPKLDNKRINTLNLISISFLKTLGTKNISESKTYLSNLIIKQVTDEQIQSLMNNIDSNRKTELLYNGIQVGLNGNTFAVLQYKYIDDSSSPPKELIKIVFDNKDKIVGIQPQKIN